MKRTEWWLVLSEMRPAAFAMCVNPREAGEKVPQTVAWKYGTVRRSFERGLLVQAGSLN